MKKILFLSVLAVLLSCTANKTPMMKLSGEIKNVENGIIYLNSVKGFGDYTPIDSTEIIDGKFNFALSLKDTTTYVFQIKPANISFSAILENGVISIKGDASKSQNGYMQIDVIGSLNESLYKTGMGFYQTISAKEKYKKLNELSLQYQNEKNEDKKWEIKDEMAPYQEELNKEVVELQIDFIKEHSNTYAAASMMRFLTSSISLNQLKDLFALFPDKLQNGDVLKDTREEIAGQERMKVGNSAPDFTLLNPDGQKISISNFKGKIVLVDFWASWCRPCRQSFPHLKELYKKYKDQGFEIIGVSNDSNHDAWKKAIKDDGISWVQVVDEFPEKYTPARVATLYAIHFLPTTYLIDREGVIFGKIENAEDLNTKLKQLFK